MSALAPTMQPASSLRRLIARHPVAAFLVMLFVVTYALVLVPVLTQPAILPFDQPLWAPLAHFFGSALPAFLVTAALQGRAGVRDLARRCFRWRVGGRWYLVALLGLPIATLLCASALFGLAPLHALGAKWPLLFTVVAPQLLLMIVLFNVTEEIGWTGFLQARLQERHGPLKASILVTIPFALWHLPDWMLAFDFTLAQLHLGLAVTGIFGIVHLFARVFIMWLYNTTKRSVLLVGLFHAAFNVTVAPHGFGGAFIPGPDGTALVLASGVVIVAAVLIVIFTQGRLAYKPNPPHA